MITKLRILLFWFAFLLSLPAAFPQGQNLTVQLLQGTHIDTVLNHYLAGEGVQLSNGRFNNHQGNINSNQIGVFQRNGFTQFPFVSGLVMCTGGATVAQGPNNSSSARADVTSSYNESALLSLSGSLHDCASLDFDFLTNSDTFVFRYIFASEEYCEYVNSDYNDVFAFFLTGPDPVTLVQTTKNVAIIPGSVSAAHPNGIPVAINNVNHGHHSSGNGPGTEPSYPQYFIHNSSTTGIQFDGYTTALEAGSPIQACVSYHMKLAIADVGDENYDSGVFIEEHSFESAPDPALSMSGFYCLHDDIVFNYTALNVDSVQIVTPSGDTLHQAPFVIHDALASDTGYYFLRAKKAVGCSGNPWVTDSVFISVRIPCVSAICDGPSVCAGEVASFAYEHDSIVGPWVNYLGTTQFSLNPPATLAHDTSIAYRFSMYDDFGCHFDTIVDVNYYALKHTFIDTVVCDSYLWSDSLHVTSGTYSRILANPAGCDSVVTLNLTVNHSVQSSDVLTLVQNQLPYYFAPADTTFQVGSPAQFQFSYVLPTYHQCDSTIALTVFINMNTSNSFDTTVCSANLPFTWHGHTFTDAGDYTETLLAANGSDSVVTYHLSVDMFSASYGNVTPVTCYGGSDGGATVLPTSGQTPYTCQWTSSSGTAVTSNMQLSNVSAGTYSYTVSDELGCTITDSVLIQTVSPPVDAGIIGDDQSHCIGEELQPFTGTPAAGHANIDYQWQISYDGTNWQPAPGSSTSQNYTYPSAAGEPFFLRRQMSCFCGTAYSNVVSLTVSSSFIDTVTVPVCQGAEFQYDGFEFPGTLTDNPGDYYFENSYSTGLCDSVLVLHLKVNPVYERDLQESVCEGAGYFANGFYIPGSATVGLEAIDSTLTLQTVGGCDSILRLHIDFVDTTLRIVSMTEDFCEAMLAELMVVTQFADYVWNTGEQSPNITVTMPGVYSVTAAQDGCQVTSHIQVFGCELQVILPNAITPSKNDGLNDYFCVPELQQRMMNDFEIRVFSRWGEQVFYSTDKNFRWNGEVNGKLPVGSVFNYVIRCTDANGKPFVFTGSLTVL